MRSRQPPIKQKKKRIPLDFEQSIYWAAIREAIHPGHVKRQAAPPTAARRIAQGSWFRKHAAVPRSDWHKVKLDIIRRADHVKFVKNADLLALSIQTSEAELTEDRTRDPFWGIGPDGQGPNWAGRILMEIRRDLRPR